MTSSALSFTSDEDFLFGVDFSKIDVSEILDETDSSTDCDDERNNVIPTYAFLIDNLLRCTNVDCEGTKIRNYEKLIEWARARGAHLEDIECRPDSYGGVCLAALNDKVEGDVIAMLPRSLRIGQTVACRRLGLPKTTPDLSALSLFLIDLMTSNQTNGNDSIRSDYSAYVACLPKTGAPNALFMSEEQIDYWSNFGLEYSKAIEGVRNQAKSCTEYIQDCLASPSYKSKEGTATNFIKADDSLLYWAISMVQSRTHGFGQARSRWLTPIFDFANHSRTPNCRLEGASEGQLILRALRRIRQEDEITIDYQVSDDAKLLATYGFSLQHALPRI